MTDRNISFPVFFLIQPRNKKLVSTFTFFPCSSFANRALILGLIFFSPTFYRMDKAEQWNK